VGFGAIIRDAARSKTWVCSRSLAWIASSSPNGDMNVCCECCISHRGLYVGPITRREEFYRVWCVWVLSWSLDNEEPWHTTAFAPWKIYYFQKMCYNRHERLDIYRMVALYCELKGNRVKIRYKDWRNCFVTGYWGYCILCLQREVIGHFLVTRLFLFWVRSWNSASTRISRTFLIPSSFHKSKCKCCARCCPSRKHWQIWNSCRHTSAVLRQTAVCHLRKNMEVGCLSRRGWGKCLTLTGRKEVTEGSRNFHNDERHDVCCLPNVGT